MATSKVHSTVRTLPRKHKQEAAKKHSKKMVAIANDYVTYKLTCTVGKQTRTRARSKTKKKTYVGITGVHKLQSTQSAICIRKNYHVDDPVSWMEDGTDLAISSDHTKLKLPHALAEEALVTAQLMTTLGRETVRGGPWCRKRLDHDDHLEIEAVAACSRWSDVAGLIKIFPRGSLAKHMRFEDYSSGKSMATACTSKTKPFPLFLPVTKRRSGRHKPGAKKKSGSHKSGTKRQSGRHKPGSRTAPSGAELRFLQLPRA